MDIGRLRRGELIAGISGLALFIIMFLNWFSFGGAIEEQTEEQAEEFGIAFDVPETSVSFNAWESFDLIDLVLLLTVIVAVGLAVATAASRTVSLPVAASALTAGLGILAVLLVLYRIIDPPSDADREYGVFLGLIAAAGVAIGGWLAMQEEGTTFGGAARDAQDRIGGGGGPGAPGGGGRPTPPPPPSGGEPTAPPPGSAPPPGGAPPPPGGGPGTTRPPS